MRLRQLSILETPVQEFVWRHIVPTDYRWDYSKLDAMEFVKRQELAGESQLWGDLEVGFAFRMVIRSPKVIEPHIMGNAAYLRTAVKQAIPVCWELGYENIVIWTQHEKIARIATRHGCRSAHVPKIVMGPDGKLQDIFILTLEKQQCATSSTAG